MPYLLSLLQAVTSIALLVTVIFIWRVWADVDSKLTIIMNLLFAASRGRDKRKDSE